MRVYDLEKAYGISLDALDIPHRILELPDLITALKQGSKPVVCLIRDEREDSKAYFSIREPLSLKRDFESVDYLDRTSDALVGLDLDLKAHIEKNGIKVINTARKGWESLIETPTIKKWRVNVLGLGDVGGTLLTGLRLLGHDVIDEIGIFDLDPKKKRRWALELGQILDPNVGHYPEIVELQMEDLFDCDMFVFCASRSVPEVGSKIKDVRMVQYESNSKIIVPYAKWLERGILRAFLLLCQTPWTNSVIKCIEAPMKMRRVFMTVVDFDLNKYAGMVSVLCLQGPAIMPMYRGLTLKQVGPLDHMART